MAASEDSHDNSDILVAILSINELKSCRWLIVHDIYTDLLASVSLTNNDPIKFITEQCAQSRSHCHDAMCDMVHAEELEANTHVDMISVYCGFNYNTMIVEAREDQFEHPGDAGHHCVFYYDTTLFSEFRQAFVLTD